MLNSHLIATIYNMFNYYYEYNKFNQKPECKLDNFYFLNEYWNFHISKESNCCKLNFQFNSKDYYLYFSVDDVVSTNFFEFTVALKSNKEHHTLSSFKLAIPSNDFIIDLSKPLNTPDGIVHLYDKCFEILVDFINSICKPLDIVKLRIESSCDNALIVDAGLTYTQVFFNENNPSKIAKVTYNKDTFETTWHIYTNGKTFLHGIVTRTSYKDYYDLFKCIRNYVLLDYSADCLKPIL